MTPAQRGNCGHRVGQFKHVKCAAQGPQMCHKTLHRQWHTGPGSHVAHLWGRYALLDASVILAPDP